MRKNFCLNTKTLSRNVSSPITGFTGHKQDSSYNSPTKLLNETTESDEAESLMNIYIETNLNENTFHLLPNEANFFSEQFEFQYKLDDHLPETQSEDILEQYKLFLNKIDQIKLQVLISNCNF